ncbi:MAG: tetratricopeptide (TPR) repeat protein [Chlamydiales bacterium]|jgi:tetratricopeptide (TPR) repeat protein
MFDSPLRPLAPLVLLVACPFVVADTIYLSDGKTIADITIQTEELLVVTYKDGNSEKSVDSDKVLAIDYDRMPKVIDRAESSVKDGFYEDAAIDFDEYITDVLDAEKPLTRYRWSTAHAMNRLIELSAAVGDYEVTVEAADRLIEKAPDSRHLPAAYLKKAEAIFLLGKKGDAVKVVDGFSAVISDRGLSDRWKLERDLARLLYDDTVQAGQRETGLQKIISGAGSKYPVVRNRARVAIGEAALNGNDLEGAEKIFSEVTADPKADDRTLAAAYTGLGDCLYQKGVGLNDAGKEGGEILQQAIVNYMRVAVVYKSQVRYTPKAMFYAGRCYAQFQDVQSQEREQRLYTAVLRDFAGTAWATEASGFRK